MRFFKNTALGALAALALSLGANAQAQAGCSDCPAAERALHERQQAHQAALAAEKEALESALMDYQRWALRATEAFKTALFEAQLDRRRALGPAPVQVNGRGFQLDQIASATRQGRSVVIFLTVEGEKALGADSPERQAEALNDIAQSLRGSFPQSPFESRLFLFPSPLPRAGEATRPRLGLSFERFPNIERKPAIIPALSERLSPEGQALFDRLRQAADRIQARGPGSWQPNLPPLASPADIFERFGHLERSALKPEPMSF